jgi:hypothetical protein
MGRRLWSPYTRKRNDACRRTGSRTPSSAGALSDTLPREPAILCIIQFNGLPRTTPSGAMLKIALHVSEVACPRPSPSRAASLSDKGRRTSHRTPIGWAGVSGGLSMARLLAARVSLLAMLLLVPSGVAQEPAKAPEIPVTSINSTCRAVLNL